MKLIKNLNWTVSKKKRNEKSQKTNNRPINNKANNKMKISKFKSLSFLNKFKRTQNYKIHLRF